VSVRAERAPRGLGLTLLAIALALGAFALVYLGLTGELSGRTSWYSAVYVVGGVGAWGAVRRRRGGGGGAGGGGPGAPPPAPTPPSCRSRSPWEGSASR
jgi:hypothetical protein